MSMCLDTLLVRQVRLSLPRQPLKGVTLIHVCGQGSTASPRTTILAIREAVEVPADSCADLTGTNQN